MRSRGIFEGNIFSLGCILLFTPISYTFHSKRASEREDYKGALKQVTTPSSHDKKPYESTRHSITKKGGVLDDVEVETALFSTAVMEDSGHPGHLDDIVAVLLSSLPENELNAIETMSDAELMTLIAKTAGDLVKQVDRKEGYLSKINDEASARAQKELYLHPQLQFLEPDLGPAVLPLQVPNGYFVPFVPRNAFGVANGVSRPPHGHASFYKHRPRGLVDVRNSPAYGYLLSAP